MNPRLPRSTLPHAYPPRLSSYVPIASAAQLERKTAAREAFTVARRDMDKLAALAALETAINAIDAESEADITLELDAAIDALGAAYVAVERAREERPC